MPQGSYWWPCTHLFWDLTYSIGLLIFPHTKQLISPLCLESSLAIQTLLSRNKTGLYTKKKKRKKERTHAGEDMEQREPLHTAGVNRYSHYGKQ